MNKRKAYAISTHLYFLAVLISITFIMYGTIYGEGETIVPAYRQVILKFEEEIAIIDSEASSNAMLNYILNFKLDSKGNIYLLDQKHPSILIFDSKGSFQGEQGKLGQGPGDFKNPMRLYIDPRDFFYVYDATNYNVTGLSPDWKVTLFTRFQAMLGSELFVTPAGDIYAFFRDMEQSGPIRRLSLTNKNGEQIKVMIEFKDSAVIVKGNKETGMVAGAMIHEYTSDAYLYPLDLNSFVYGYNMENNFHIYNTSNNKDRVITLPGSKTKITSEEEKYFEDTCGKWAMLPDYRPFFKRLLCDEKGRIYVTRTRPVLSEEKSIEIDIFSKEGKYLYRATSPVVFTLVRDGFVYNAGKDKSGETILKRYRIKNYKSLHY